MKPLERIKEIEKDISLFKEKAKNEQKQISTYEGYRILEAQKRIYLLAIGDELKWLESIKYRDQDWFKPRIKQRIEFLKKKLNEDKNG